jgi:solute carrier family 25 phosphate transporter 23/24/25/41
MQSFAKMYKVEGVVGFFKGNGTNMIRIIPFSAIEFFSYDFYKHIFFSHRANTDFSSKLICGGMTGMTASSIVISLI